MRGLAGQRVQHRPHCIWIHHKKRLANVGPAESVLTQTGQEQGCNSDEARFDEMTLVIPSAIHARAPFAFNSVTTNRAVGLTLPIEMRLASYHGKLARPLRDVAAHLQEWKHYPSLCNDRSGFNAPPAVQLLTLA